MSEPEEMPDALHRADNSATSAPRSDASNTVPGAESQSQPPVQRGRRALKRVIGLVVVAAILILLGADLARSWDTLAKYHWQVSAPLLALAFVGFVAQTLSYPLIWRSVLRRLGQPLSLPKSVRIYLASEFVRYIPGNVWHVLTRIFWAEREGIPKSIGFISITVELVTKLAGGALVFAVTLLFWPHIDALGQVFSGGTALIVGLAAIPVLLALLQPRLLGWCLNRALKLMRKPAITLPMRYRDVLVVTFWWCASWVIGGVAFYLLLLGIAGTGATGAVSPVLLTLALCIGIYALGWDIGFLSFITPSGLGFREAAIILLLGLAAVTPTIALATVIAFLSRILATLAELLCVSGAHFIVSRLERTAKNAQAAEEQPAVSAFTE
ncbi:MAG TPA: lysylphosphatidylglycerol synthase transmembrane domain-containing protein [Ktedonobacterales bacterium]|jgi:hypothetical protein